MEKVSVVIPTRNRKESLLKTLEALSKQEVALHEVIVVDSSDIPVVLSEINGKFRFANCSVVESRPSVCAQRNAGIRRATGNYILVLDDDISLQENYVALCLKFFEENSKALVVTGLVVEQDRSGVWQYQFTAPSFFSLLWCFIFQLSVWADVTKTRKTFLNASLLGLLQSYYVRKKNGVSLAGWPILTHFGDSFFRGQIYYLGAAMAKREWFLNNIYTERLDEHGIGDNYGLAIKLLPEQGVFVLTGTRAYHYKIPDNRLGVTEAYYKRVLALDYFSRLNKTASRRWLIWSLFGNLLDAGLHGQTDRIARNCKLIWVLSLNRNPLLRPPSQ